MTLLYTCVGVAYKKAFAGNYLHFININFVFIRHGILKGEPTSHCQDMLLELRKGGERGRNTPRGGGAKSCSPLLVAPLCTGGRQVTFLQLCSGKVIT